MKQSSKGQMSSRNLIALFFLAALLFMSMGSLRANAISNQTSEAALQLELEIWSATALLENADANPQIVVQLLASPSEYACVATFDPSNATLLVEMTQFASSSHVPIELAFVEVGIKNTPGYYQIEVKVDGGAIVLVIDEF